MNNAGLAYCKSSEDSFNRCTTKDKPHYGWSDSCVQERILRLDIEARMYDLDSSDVNALERLAVATLKEDFVKKYTYE